MAQVVPADGGRPARLKKSLKWRLTIGSRKYIGAPEPLPSKDPGLQAQVFAYEASSLTD